MPLFRFRSRDHVTVAMGGTETGRTGPRIRCIGRTDDMLIVRGVNLFPTAIRSVLDTINGDVSGLFSITPNQQGVKQEPPLPILVEVAAGKNPDNNQLASDIKRQIKERLLVTADVTLVGNNTLPRETYKSKLVDYSRAS